MIGNCGGFYFCYGIRKVRLFCLFLIMMVMLLHSSHSHAGVTPAISRVIFTQGDKESSLELVNANHYPVVVQAWVDNGDVTSTPQEADSPVIVIPPVFKMDPADKKVIRLVNTDQALPKDRESLYWLNIYEIPPTKKDPQPDATSLTLTMRTQMKVIIRPQTIAKKMQSVAKMLKFSLQNNHGKSKLIISNTSPFYITLSQLQVIVPGENINIAGSMLEPFSKTENELAAVYPGKGKTIKVSMASINDSGNQEFNEVGIFAE